MIDTKKFVNFNGIFKSLELYDEELMGQYRLGKQKYYIKDNIKMYKKKCRELCVAEKKLILEHYLGHVQGKCDKCDDPFDWQSCRICNYDVYENSFNYLHKSDFINKMHDIKKDLGLETTMQKWITISPKKCSDIGGVLGGLDKTLHQYFTMDIPRAKHIKWCLELGADGDHPHCHILCEPVSDGALKNFSRDFTKLFKNNCKLKVVENNKICFNIQTIKRPEYIRARIEYLNNETKGITHHNPHDSRIESEFGVKKYVFIAE